MSRCIRLQCWSPRGHVLDLGAPWGQYGISLALALRVKSLALALALRVKSLALALRVKSLALALTLAQSLNVQPLSVPELRTRLHHYNRPSKTVRTSPLSYQYRHTTANNLWTRVTVMKYLHFIISSLSMQLWILGHWLWMSSLASVLGQCVLDSSTVHL